MHSPSRVPSKSTPCICLVGLGWLYSYGPDSDATADVKGTHGNSWTDETVALPPQPHPSTVQLCRRTLSDVHAEHVIGDARRRDQGDIGQLRRRDTMPADRGGGAAGAPLQPASRPSAADGWYCRPTVQLAHAYCNTQVHRRGPLVHGLTVDRSVSLPRLAILAVHLLFSCFSTGAVTYRLSHQPSHRPVVRGLRSRGQRGDKKTQTRTMPPASKQQSRD